MNIGQLLQNLYRRGTPAWAVKYFKEKLLSGLLIDLLAREREGIPINVCDDVKATIADAILQVEYVKDGGFFYKHLHENLTEFLEIYSKWNNGGSPEKRYYFLTKLRDRKSSIFASFIDRMNDLKQRGQQDARYQEYLILLNSEQRQNAAINRAFQILVDRHPDIFPELGRRLIIFNQRIDGL